MRYLISKGIGDIFLNLMKGSWRKGRMKVGKMGLNWISMD